MWFDLVAECLSTRLLISSHLVGCGLYTCTITSITLRKKCLELQTSVMLRNTAQCLSAARFAPKSLTTPNLYNAYHLACVRPTLCMCTISTVLQTIGLVMKFLLSSPFLPLLRHSEALNVVRRGLDMVASYRPSVNMTWPGVDELMQDCLPQNVEVSNKWEGGKKGRKGGERREEEREGRRKEEREGGREAVREGGTEGGGER